MPGLEQLIEKKKDKLEGIKTEEFYQRLEQLNKGYNFLRTVAQPEKGELNQIPLSVKDSICTQGVTTSAGSQIIADYKPPFNATVVDRAEAKDCQVVGKTNMDEFGFGTFSTNCAFTTPKNPWDRERSCGGSSGGAAGLTSALRYPHLALGQSTGGSISCPAAFCGVVGLTPTYGLVSRYGLISYANSLDKIGPLGKKVKDVALLLDMIKGEDKRDQTTLDKEIGSLTANLKAKVDGLKVGLPQQYFEFSGLETGVKEQIWQSIKQLEDLGADYEQVDMPKIQKKYAVPSYYIIAMAEASTNLAKYCGMRYGLEGDKEGKNYNQYFSKMRQQGFGQEAKRRILLGTYARMAGYRDQYYLKALKVRTLVINEFKRSFKDYDLLAAPAMPMIAPRFDQIDDLSPEEIYAMDTLTIGPNLAGLPHLSLPCGFVEGMPVGLHLIGDHLNEQQVLNAGYALEQKLGLNLDPEV